MRGVDSYTENLFSSVKLDDFVLANHPLRTIRTWVNEALTKMDSKFSLMYEADIKGADVRVPRLQESAAKQGRQILRPSRISAPSTQFPRSKELLKARLAPI